MFTNDEEILRNCSWALQHITDKLEMDDLADIVNRNFVLIQTAMDIVIKNKSQKVDVLAPIAQFIGNLILGDIETTKVNKIKNNHFFLLVNQKLN